MELHRNKYTAQLRIRVVHTDIRLAVLTAFHHAAFAPRPIASAPAAIAIDCSAEAPLTTPEIAPRGKACRACGVHKPLTEFFKIDGQRQARRAACKDCENDADVRQQAKAQKKRPVKAPQPQKPVSDRYALGADDEDQDLFYLGTKGGPVTLDVLQAYARSMPGTRVVFTCGTTRVDAVYAGASNDDFQYAHGSWPVDADYISRVLNQFNSGRAAGGFW